MRALAFGAGQEARMYVGSGRGELILGVLMLISLLLGMRVRHSKGLLAYLIVMAVLFLAAMALAMRLVDSARPGSVFRMFGRDPAALGIVLWAPYLLGGVLVWLFGAGGRGGRMERAGPARTFAPERRAAAEPSLGRQTVRRVFVTVTAAVASYAILSFLGLENTPSVFTAIGLALLAILFG